MMSSTSNMKLGGFFLLASLLTLNTRLQAIGVCVEQCREDGDCAAGEKCVSDGCGHVCSPAPRASVCESQCFRDQDCGAGRRCVSEGCNRVCSPAPQASVGICVQRCRGNWDCGAGERCMRKGCSRVCSPVRTGGVGICLDQCRGHRDCPAGSQCVSNGCGRVCSPTQDQQAEQRPGTCPRVPEGMVGTCAESCTGDGSCPPGQKCCSNGCGKSCQVPDLGFTIHLDDK
ncbi:WAP four-disulfide core domain protein 3-like [Muntiacus reevesi]|uniref:WAP four-disulfide core domain protein 3-like n=1 Tax=Muntiacus reevesi TaxID=9886 RepID=UPI003307A2B5